MKKICISLVGIALVISTSALAKPPQPAPSCPAPSGLYAAFGEADCDGDTVTEAAILVNWDDTTCFNPAKYSIQVIGSYTVDCDAGTSTLVKFNDVSSFTSDACIPLSTTVDVDGDLIPDFTLGEASAITVMVKAIDPWSGKKTRRNQSSEFASCGPMDVPGDAVDGDCDAEVDEAPVTWYQDLDGDGYGNDAVTVASDCGQPTGYVATGGDCNDDDAAVNPGATEICDDGIDNDCDGAVDVADPDCAV